MSPAGETGTSSTPPRANASAHGASKIESTPNSRGAAVVSENIGCARCPEVRPWIQRDIEQVKECKADAMLQALLQRASSAPETQQPELLQKCLKAVLPVCNGQVTARGIYSSGIETALEKYVRPGVEDKFYGPFIEATNIALACLEEIKVHGMCAPVPAVDMICQQNDMPMYQNHQTVKSTRKPDLVFLPLNSACTPFKDEKGVGNCTGYPRKGGKKGKQQDNENDDEKRKAHMVKNAMTKPPAPLLWKDVLTCIEFKRKTNRKKPIKPPRSSCKVNEYVPTKPEYLPVDHLKAEDPVPGPSQTATQPASDTAIVSSGLTAAQPSEGGSSSKRKATDTLQSAAKKSRIDPNEPDVTVQTGMYAAEMFAANLAVNHIINLIVVDDVMWIWYYDRQGIIQSSGINFIQDLPRFMVLLYALQRFELEDWGRNKDFLPVQVEGKQCHEFKIKDVELGDVDLLLHTSHDERVTHYGLQGRATNVVPVTSEALAKKYDNLPDGMVAKIFWGEVGHTSEPEILKKVRGDRQGARYCKRPYSPAALVPQVHESYVRHPRSARLFQNPLKGSRVLYILVFPKLLPITDLYDKGLFDVWRQCILCHLTLWKEGVYHRDVSPGNLMWYWKDGKRMGVLNDYDLSSLANDQGPRGNERTGTVPFMALDLLTAKGQRGEVKHLYCHDLESFIWCFAWICLRYKQGVPLPVESRPLDIWATAGAVTCGKEKYFFLRHFEDYDSSHLETLTWNFLVECLWELKTDDERRFNLRMKQRLSKAGEQPDAEESNSDIDDFLHKFTGSTNWDELSKPC
ncbi:hypothetical protein EDB19DRAFT_1914396 [Suillus lakei]|nr:hypothetical protein EDB19DRAFT_1914396 [Suillus lakei]